MRSDASKSESDLERSARGAESMAVNNRSTVCFYDVEGARPPRGLFTLDLMNWWTANNADKSGVFEGSDVDSMHANTEQAEGLHATIPLTH